MKQFIVAQEDESTFNVFDRDDFNKDGWLIGYEGKAGYNIEDYDIIAEFDTFEEACECADLSTN